MATPAGSNDALIADPKERTAILNRLKRLEGQVRGLQTMVEAGKDCDAVLTQVMAARSALNQVGLLIIGRFMKTCLLADEDLPKEELVDRALAVLLRYVDLPENWPAGAAE
jgi:DNA-binding FrmR family transcriptional regulator